MNILIVDDHPMIIDSYTSIISNMKVDYNFNFLSATNCESANYLIEHNFNLDNRIDLAIFDVNLPIFKERSIFCGGDLASLFKIKYPNSKIIMITMHSESLLINRILQKVNPHGFLNKSDINNQTFLKAFKKILSGKYYYTETIRNSFLEYNRQKFNFDKIDFEIITLLSKGIKTKEMPNYLSITLSAIEKRKVKIKFQILNDRGSDKELIEKAKKLKIL